MTTDAKPTDATSKAQHLSRPLVYPDLVVVEWVDATNIATWENLDELADWAKDGGFVCRNVGYLVYEDDSCVVLAARVALDAEPQQVGLFERIPKGIILDRWSVTRPRRR